MQRTFSLSAGQTLSILVGMQPCTFTTLYPGGAGGILHEILDVTPVFSALCIVYICLLASSLVRYICGSWQRLLNFHSSGIALLTEFKNK
jgi:hypothetical protein